MQRGALAVFVAATIDAAVGQMPYTEQTVIQALPSGWAVVERKIGEIPWGHHWCEDYKEITGTKLVIRGPAAAKSRFRNSNGSWSDAVTGAEALEVWLMPGTYGEGWRNSVCFHRPIQPDLVIANSNLRVYARPSAHQSAEEQRQFKDLLSKATAVESPESPWNDPKRISWQSWSADLRAQLANESKR